ncbi:MAG: SAM-dependent methyltransferase [Eubacteriales bacterium]|jgi:protein-L-isoaspartate O-methyltransferase
MAKFIPKTTKVLERVAAKNGSIYRAISLYYKRLVKAEVALADIRPTDRVLCIGGGPCPFSGILLHECTGAHVTIIDNDDHCVRVARNLIRKLDYEDSIDILHTDGNEISPENYNVIHMAVQVSPIEKVFSHIKQGCRQGAKILVRLPKKGLSKLYSIGDRSTFHACSRKVFHNWRNVESTALFIKS